MHYEQWEHEHIIHNMNEKRKKYIKVAPPCALPGAFPNTVEVFFSDRGANKILHPLHLRGLRILWSLWELHLFTKVFAWKLYKHRCTMKRGPYVTDVSPCCGPNVTFSRPWARKVPTRRFAHAETNCHMYNTHSHTIGLQLLPPHICTDYKMQRSLMCSVTSAIFYLRV